MIWFKLKELERQLNEGEVSEKKGLQYFITYLIFAFIFIYLPEFSGYSNNWFYLFELVIVLAILIHSFTTTFRMNKKSGNEQFLLKALSISFVIAIRLTMIFSLLYLLYKIIMFIIPEDYFLFLYDLTTGDIPNMIFSVVIAAIFNIMLTRSFGRFLQPKVKSGQQALIQEQLNET